MSSAVNKLSTIFNKSLPTMVKGIRAHKDKGEHEYIAKCLQEIKEELQTTYADTKAQALQKLIYLQMLGYDTSWASFHIVEVMSSPWFGHKRIGYLAASLMFTKDTDVILLTTHLFRKGFTSTASAGSTLNSEGLQYETGAAISSLANICTPDLAMDLLSDVYGLMNSSRPYIRKKAVLVLLRMFKQWPKSLRLSFDRLKEKLNDENQGVVSAAVYVICELAAKNPKNYLSLAPQFFKILTTSSNNWVLIKVVKLLGSLSPLEPRLAKKLQEPLTDVINTTPAKSLLYECVNTLLAGELKSKTLVKVCLEKLRSFIEDPDQNLKYLGLLGLHKLMKRHPRVVAEHKDLILNCLKDEDVTIRMRALDLITSMVSDRNLQPIVKKLMEHLEQSEGTYREHVLTRILAIGSADNYENVSDFEWYVSTLVDLTHVVGASRENAGRITYQLMDVTIRVPAVRRHAVKSMSEVLIAGRLQSQAVTRNNMCEVLYAVGFIVGEFAEYVEEHTEILKNLVKPEVALLSMNVQNVFIQSALKVLASGMLQPFDQVGDDSVDLTAKTKDLLGRKGKTDNEDEEEENSELTEEEKAAKAAKKAAERAAAEDAEPEQEEDDVDDNGVKRRKVKAKKRTFAEYLAFLGSMFDSLYLNLPPFTRSNDVEVQERAVATYEFLGWLIEFSDMQSVCTAKIERKGKKDDKKDKKDDKSNEEAKETTPTPAPVPVVEKREEFNLLSLDSLSALPSTTISSPTQNGAPTSNGINHATPVPIITPSAAPVTTALSPTSSQPSRDKLKSLSLQFNLLFAERLNPVNHKAQKKVPLPKGLDLENAINEDWERGEDDESEDEDEVEESESEDEDEDNGKKKKNKKKDKKSKNKSQDFDQEDYNKPLTEAEKEEARKRNEARKAAQMHDPFYIKDSKPSANSSTGLMLGTPIINLDEIPMKRLDDGDLPPIHVENSDKKKDKKKKKKKDEEDDDIFNLKGKDLRPKKTFKVTANEDLPSDAEEDDSSRKKKGKKGKTAAISKNSDDESGVDDELDVDLTTPLGADEVIPKVKSYAEKSREQKEKEKGKDGEKKKKEKKEKKKKNTKKIRRKIKIVRRRIVKIKKKMLHQ